MRIGLIADRIGLGTGGLETYERGLIQGLMRLDHQNHYQIFCRFREAWGSLASFPGNFAFTPVCPQSTWLRFILGLPLSLRQARLDLVHVCFAPPLISPGHTVITVHDLYPFHYHNSMPHSIALRLRFLLTRAIKSSARIIAVSEVTKQDLVKIFGIEQQRISVIHLGVDAHYQPGIGWRRIESVSRRYGLPENYLLYVGRVDPRKNLSKLFEACRILKEGRKLSHKLVVVGKIEPWGKGSLALVRQWGLEKDIILPGYVAAADLPAIYSGAAAFVFPSLFEGFGFPPLEAMACGVPVIASQIPAHIEMLGEAAMFFDPNDAEGLASTINRVLKDDDLREELRAKGLSRATSFTWEKTARRTLEVYRSVIGIETENSPQ